MHVPRDVIEIWEIERVCNAAPTERKQIPWPWSTDVLHSVIPASVHAPSALSISAPRGDGTRSYTLCTSPCPSQFDARSVYKLSRTVFIHPERYLNGEHSMPEHDAIYKGT